MSEWPVQRSRDLYNIAYWSDGFFDINEQGRVVAYPDGHRNHLGIDLIELADTMHQAGLTLPILVRFTDILKSRFSRLKNAFNRAIKEYDYQGNFLGVYPVKVNQQRRVLEEVVKVGGGLEAGSKPELLAVLALSQQGSVIVCNGYKDREYIRLALIGQRLGYRVYIILEKLSELDIVLSEAKKMGLEPC